jgi:hypothetical protein
MLGMPSQIGGGDLKRSNLHCAALTGDVVLACEIIRLGATIDLKDAIGKTPLYLAVETLSQMTLSANFAGSLSRSRATNKLQGDLTGMLRPLRFVTRRLMQ